MFAPKLMLNKQVVVFGDSITRDWDRLLPGFTPKVYCYSGAVIGTKFVDTVLKKVKNFVSNQQLIIVLHIGTNNLGNRIASKRQDPSTVLCLFSDLVVKLLKYPKITIIISSLLPRTDIVLHEAIGETNKLLRNLPQTYGDRVIFLNTYRPFIIKRDRKAVPEIKEELYKSDHLHPDDNGKILIVRLLFSAVKHVKSYC